MERKNKYFGRDVSRDNFKFGKPLEKTNPGDGEHENPEICPIRMKPWKKGIVPKPAGDYLQSGSIDGKSKTTVIAPAPVVFNREAGNPEGTNPVDKLQKPARHGHVYPGRPYPAKGNMTGHKAT